MHREAVGHDRRFVFHFEIGEVVVLETLRERGAAMRWQATSAHRARVAEDRGGPANAAVDAFRISMIATRVLCQSGLAAKGFATASNSTLVRTSASVNPPVTSQRA